MTNADKYPHLVTAKTRHPEDMAYLSKWLTQEPSNDGNPLLLRTWNGELRRTESFLDPTSYRHPDGWDLVNDRPWFK